MPHVLAAGDLFVTPSLFIDAIKARTGPEAEVSFSELTLPWPIEPFGPVGSVNEASGDPTALIGALAGAEVAVTQMAPFTAEVFESSPDLRLISVCRGGPVNVDLDAATRAGVIVSFAPGRNAVAAAEFAVGLMLTAMRRVVIADADLKKGTWRGDYYTYDNAGSELDGATVGLIGYGAIGRIVARILRAFGSTVVTFDPYASAEAIAADGVELVELEDLLRRSSVVSLHARLTAETHHLLNAENLSLLPVGAVLVNSARGDLLDYAPLPELLSSGRLGALALDVYDVEPPSADWPLFAAPNVVLSPHLAGATKQTAERAANIVADDIAAYLRGDRPRYVANPDVWNVLSERFGS
ncbi:2-hydroxyacid dehydrogenase [Subtercola boreus]|uniref:Hydroxyacid dehydrogenase n=1 Tax=Subtercola boreus TaxID=120213 RepID=A0A3E0WC71_9MICO|nr:2-hydroxyacid dehydrogenase [Subtercola boreus]RFA20825.1 hydroxyacid dehydrogenase [Subtercola boreus]RFA20940.1 hydroxyacid dehydrogenase [Subtercola boreus]RFA27133.1 hydroxyacid dehydrogenase [Subtercola boreus]